MKCTELLVEDHEIISRALDVLEQMSKRVGSHQVLEHDDVEIILRFLRSFADEYHQGKEESALFPELRQVLEAREGPVHQMLFEHDQERSLLDGIEDALFRKKGQEFVHFSDRLISLMRNHIRKENDILFGIVERLLSPEQDQKIVAQFERFTVDAAFIRELRSLETKYLRKKAA
jgi:hemerythrin-like domain-containing protein